MRKTHLDRIATVTTARRLLLCVPLAAALYLLSGESTLLAADQRQVQVFVINSLPAADMITTVQPLLSNASSVSAFHDKLIVRGTASEIAAVKTLLDQLDQPARRLLIELRQRGSNTVSGSGVEYGVNSEHLRLGQAPQDAGAQLRYRQTETRGANDGVQRIQALDGRPALIQTGTSVPMVTATEGGSRYAPRYTTVLEYRDAISGFYAVPRLHGDQVTVEVYQQANTPGQAGNFDVQRASMVLRGPLGEWLPLGAVGGNEQQSDQAIGRHLQTRREHDRQWELRVSPLDP